MCSLIMPILHPQSPILVMKAPALLGDPGYNIVSLSLNPKLKTLKP